LRCSSYLGKAAVTGRLHKIAHAPKLTSEQIKELVRRKRDEAKRQP
jgi:hypothetical protein